MFWRLNPVIPVVHEHAMLRVHSTLDNRIDEHTITSDINMPAIIGCFIICFVWTLFVKVYAFCEGTQLDASAEKTVSVFCVATREEAVMEKNAVERLDRRSVVRNIDVGIIKWYVYI